MEIEWHKPIVRALKTQKREAEDVRTARVFLGPETSESKSRAILIKYVIRRNQLRSI